MFVVTKGDKEQVMPRPRVLHVSAKTGEGIDEWLQWLEDQTTALRTPLG